MPVQVRWGLRKERVKCYRLGLPLQAGLKMGKVCAVELVFEKGGQSECFEVHMVALARRGLILKRFVREWGVSLRGAEKWLVEIEVEVAAMLATAGYVTLLKIGQNGRDLQ